MYVEKKGISVVAKEDSLHKSFKGAPLYIWFYNLYKTGLFDIFTQPCLRACSNSLCAHRVRDPLATQGGLNHNSFKGRPPYNVKTDSKQKKLTF